MAKSNRIRTLVLVMIVAVAAAAVGAGVFAISRVPVRSEVSGVAEEEPSDAEASPPASAQTIEAEARLVADSLSTATGEWADHRISVEVLTRLRRPVVVILTDIDSEQAEEAGEVFARAWDRAASTRTARGSACTFYLELRSSEGEVMARASSTDERWLLDLPPAPEDVEALRDWLDTAYGPSSGAGEAWFGRMTGIRADGTRIVVSTDLDQTDPADLDAAQTIIDAVDSSGLDFAQSVAVLFADGHWEWSSVLVGQDPFSAEAP